MARVCALLSSRVSRFLGFVLPKGIGSLLLSGTMTIHRLFQRDACYYRERLNRSCAMRPERNEHSASRYQDSLSFRRSYPDNQTWRDSLQPALHTKAIMLG